MLEMMKYPIEVLNKSGLIDEGDRQMFACNNT